MHRSLRSRQFRCSHHISSRSLKSGLHICLLAFSYRSRSVREGRKIEVFLDMSWLTSFARWYKACSKFPSAAQKSPRPRCNLYWRAALQSGVLRTIHWAWERYFDASGRRPAPKMRHRNRQATEHFFIQKISEYCPWTLCSSSKRSPSLWIPHFSPEHSSVEWVFSIEFTERLGVYGYKRSQKPRTAFN